MRFKSFVILFNIIIFLFYPAQAFEKSDIENIQILLNKKNYLSLNSLSRDNYKNKVIIEKNKKKFSGKILNNEKEYEIKLWLDGLSPEHFDSNILENNTLEIRVKKDYLINTKKFRLISPEAFTINFTQNYNEMLKYLKLPSRYYRFVKLNINYAKEFKGTFASKDKIFVLEEKIGEDFLDRNNLRQSVIFERDLFSTKKFTKTIFEQRNKIISEEKAKSIIEDIKKKRKYRTKINNKSTEKIEKYAINLFELFLDDKLSFEQVFDTNQVTKMFSLHILTNSLHALDDLNVKFYFNPIIKKISLIPTDPHQPKLINKNYKFSNEEIKYLNKIIVNNNFFNKSVWYSKLLKDKVFQEQLIEKLKALIFDDNFLVFLEELKKKDNDYMRIKYLERVINNLNHLKENFSKSKSIQKFYIENKNFINDEYFEYDHKNKKIYFKKFIISKSISISKHFRDYELIIKDKDLVFENNGSLNINSKFKCTASNNKNIISSISNNNFIYFFGKKTIIDNCDFKNFNHTLSNEFTTSPITFYKTNLIMKESTIINSNSEDLINIIESTVEMSDSLFKNSTSDAVDIDNSIGFIKNTRIENCGNDCLDFSSSKFEIEGLIVKNSIDKGVSIGEKSDIIIKNSYISDCSFICLAIKDSSIVSLNKIYFKNGKVAVADYIKKKIFNAPFVKSNDLKYKEIESQRIKSKNLNEIINLKN
jgi:hypothetical protein